MKPSELRIGNWYRHNELNQDFVLDLGYWIDALIAYRNDGFLRDVDLEWMDGVPLTEEWLKRFGFSTYDNELDFREWAITYDPINYAKSMLCSICQDGDYRDNEPFYMEAVFGDVEQRIEIKYVHQLQNLYFCLTGEELTTQ